MELEQIRRISLVGFLEGMGHVPVSRKGNDVWFRSPFRNERTASFKVDTQRNVWFDFGLGKGGDIFHLAGELTGSTGFMEQLAGCLFHLGDSLHHVHRNADGSRLIGDGAGDGRN